MGFNLMLLAYLFLSLFVFIIAFYLPGKLLVDLIYPKIEGKFPLSFSVGISLWAITSYFLHALNLFLLIWIYLAFFSVAFLVNIKKKYKKNKSTKLDYLLFTIISIGSFFQLMAVFPSGLSDSSGVWFYHINAYDGIYYLGIAKSLISNFPPPEPGFAGHVVINYHYLSGLVVGDIANLFRLPVIFLNFQAFPVLISIVRGLLAYYVGLSFSSRKDVGRIFAFLAYFGSDVGYLTSLILLGHLTVNELQPIDSANLLLTNTPKAFAELVFLGGLLLLIQYIKEKKKLQFVFTSLVLISTVGFKVYYGMFSALLIFLVNLYEIIKTRKFINFIYLAPSILLGLLVYLPTNSGAGGLFWSPFSWPRHYFASGSLQATMWHLKEQVYKEHNNYLRVFILNIQETIVFLITIFGTRILGLTPLTTGNSQMRKLQLLLLISTILFIFLGIFYLQESGLFNVFNFFSVAALILSLLTSLFVSLFARKRKWFITIAMLVILLSLPRPFANLFDQFQSVVTKKRDAYLINNQEIEALTYLKRNAPKTSIVLVGPNNSRDYNSPYIEYFSERSTFLSNLNILQSHNQPTSEREKIVNNIFSTSNKSDFFSKLSTNNIDYIYFKLPSNFADNFSFTDDEIFYQNDGVLIIRRI